MQIPGGLQPRLGSDILGGITDDNPQIPENGRLQGPPNNGKTPLITTLSSPQRGEEVIVIGHGDPVGSLSQEMCTSNQGQHHTPGGETSNPPQVRWGCGSAPRSGLRDA